MGAALFLGCKRRAGAVEAHTVVNQGFGAEDRRVAGAILAQRGPNQRFRAAARQVVKAILAQRGPNHRFRAAVRRVVRSLRLRKRFYTIGKWCQLPRVKSLFDGVKRVNGRVVRVHRVESPAGSHLRP